MAPDFDLSAELSLPEEELLERLGGELLGGGRSVTPEDRDKNRRFATRWLERWLQLHREQICNDPRVVVLLADGSAAKSLEEFAVIVDVLSPLMGTPPVMTVALIVAKRGLGRLCGT